MLGTSLNAFANAGGYNFLLKFHDKGENSTGDFSLDEVFHLIECTSYLPFIAKGKPLCSTNDATRASRSKRKTSQYQTCPTACQKLHTFGMLDELAFVSCLENTYTNLYAACVAARNCSFCRAVNS